jgi:hypothetical protein
VGAPDERAPLEARRCPVAPSVRPRVRGGPRGPPGEEKGMPAPFAQITLAGPVLPGRPREERRQVGRDGAVEHRVLRLAALVGRARARERAHGPAGQHGPCRVVTEASPSMVTGRCREAASGGPRAILSPEGYSREERSIVRSIVVDVPVMFRIRLHTGALSVCRYSSPTALSSKRTCN